MVNPELFENTSHNNKKVNWFPSPYLVRACGSVYFCLDFTVNNLVYEKFRI